jgi:WD40 repeat protein
MVKSNSRKVLQQKLWLRPSAGILLVVFILSISGMAFAQGVLDPLDILIIDWSPDGQTLAIGYWNNEVWLYDLNMEPVTQLPLETGQDIRSLSWNPESNMLAAGTRGAEFRDSRVTIWDVNTGTVHTIIQQNQASIAQFAWSPDGTRLAATEGEHINIWDPITGNLLSTLPGHEWPASAVDIDWHPDGTLLASGGDDYMVRVWDTTTGEQVQVFPAPTEYWVSTVNWSPDGSMMAVTSLNNIYIWDITNNQIIATLTEHTDTVYAVDWRSNTIASSGPDKTIRIWDAETWQLINTITLEQGVSRTISLSPDGQQLAYSGGESIEIIPVPVLPIAAAPPNQTLTDTDASGSETVTLDGSASTDPDGTIVSYSWTENDVEIATGVTPTVDLPVGEHTITLTVTDDDGLTASDACQES